jgi:nicotinamidase-related amidase
MAESDLPLTLFDLVGAKFSPPDLGGSVLVLIDYQNEYLAGPLALKRGFDAVDQAVKLLWAVRRAGGRVIHVVHAGRPDGVFDRAQYRGAIIASLAPQDDEIVIEKQNPNAFAGTDLAAYLGAGDTPIIIAGFMTHNCVSSTARAALDLGYLPIVVDDASATRDLPAEGGVIDAASLHRAELAALADRHAWVRNVSQLIEGSPSRENTASGELIDA